MNRSEKLLRICHLTVSYATELEGPLRAVDGVELALDSGEILGLLGESGCGKSTLAAAIPRLIANNANVETGEIWFQGSNVMALGENALREVRGRQIAIISQDPTLALNPVLTAGRQISEAILAHEALSATQRRERVLELLGEVGFVRPQEIYAAYPHQLSGGQRQRIVIAQAIASKPALLIADEPTSKLDASLQQDILKLLSQIREHHGTAVLVVTHDPASVAILADRIAVMYAGRIVETGTTTELFSRPLHPYTRALVEIARAAFAVLPARALPAIDGESPNPARFPRGCRFEPRCSDRMEICVKQDPAMFWPEPNRPVSCFKYGQ